MYGAYSCHLPFFFFSLGRLVFSPFPNLGEILIVRILMEVRGAMYTLSFL